MPRPPASLNDFIGQHRVIGHVRKLIAGALQRREAMGSLLILGPPGMGKTKLAEAVAREYSASPTRALDGTFLKILAGPRITSTLVDKLGQLEFASFLFIDEIHGLDRDAQELLHLALDEHRTLAFREDGRLDRSSSRTIAGFTLIGASTEPGKLTHALRSRLHQIILDPYDVRELKAIADATGSALDIDLTPQAARHLAERSQQTPRSIEQLLRQLAVTRAIRPRAGSDKIKVDQDAVRAFLDELGVDKRGLNTFQQQYLLVLAAAGRAVSLNVTRSRLGIDKGYIQSEVEPLLLHLGLIEVGPTGRTLTSRGAAVTEELALQKAPISQGEPPEASNPQRADDPSAVTGPDGAAT
jgi:holliday junction DNA helicase RuvB